MSLRSERPQAVTHTLKSVRHHRIEFRLPDPPADDEECFVVALRGGGEVRLRPQDFQQFIAVLRQARQQIMGGEL